MSALDSTRVAAVPSASSATAVDLDAAFRTHAPFLARMVGRMLGPSAPVEDVVQQCFLVAHQRRATLADGPGLRAWLYRTCMHLVAHERRSFARRNRLRDAVALLWPSSPPVDDVLDSAGRRARMQRALARLPVGLREVFVLYEMEGMTAPEIAALLEVAQGTVWRRAHEARAHFERAWQEEAP
jgi:RNA polymerase sigma-70 factor, ECF subfamily